MQLICPPPPPTFPTPSPNSGHYFAENGEKKQKKKNERNFDTHKRKMRVLALAGTQELNDSRNKIIMGRDSAIEEKLPLISRVRERRKSGKSMRK